MKAIIYDEFKCNYYNSHEMSVYAYKGPSVLQITKRHQGTS